MQRVRIVFMTMSVGLLLLGSGALMADRHTREDLYEALGNLAEVVHLVESEYVDELNQEALSLSLDAGIIESVDPWGAVLESDQVESYLALVTQPPAYGLSVSTRLGSAAVRQALSGSPAAAAGLESWEVIEEIAGVATRGRPLWQIRLELAKRLAAGESVTCSVVDRFVDERREVVLSAAPWTPEPLTVEEIDGVRVLRLESLPVGAAVQLAKQLLPASPVVLDLRQLAWGREEEAMAAADVFVSSGVLGRWQGRKAGEASYPASPQTATSALPIVLVGSATEGVGEALAAALQSAGATLVGSRTAGHAPHMQLVSAGEIHLWMPVGQWMRGDDEAIDGDGVVPTEVVEAADEGSDEDPVLERAMELLAPALEQAA